MDATQVHTSLNYFPIIGVFVGMILLAYGFWRKSNTASRISLMLLCLTAVIAFGVFGSGEVAGKGAELMAGPVWENIAAHKASALPAFAAIELTGILALIGLILIFRRSTVARWNVVAVLILSLAALGLTARTTLLGRHIYSAGATVNK
jgi:uncharacterized membrane protein